MKQDSDRKSKRRKRTSDLVPSSSPSSFGKSPTTSDLPQLRPSSEGIDSPTKLNSNSSMPPPPSPRRNAKASPSHRSITPPSSISPHKSSSVVSVRVPSTHEQPSATLSESQLDSLTMKYLNRQRTAANKIRSPALPAQVRSLVSSSRPNRPSKARRALFQVCLFSNYPRFHCKKPLSPVLQRAKKLIPPRPYAIASSSPVNSTSRTLLPSGLKVVGTSVGCVN